MDDSPSDRQKGEVPLPRVEASLDFTCLRACIAWHSIAASEPHICPDTYLPTYLLSTSAPIRDAEPVDWDAGRWETRDWTVSSFYRMLKTCTLWLIWWVCKSCHVMFSNYSWLCGRDHMRYWSFDSFLHLGGQEGVNLAWYLPSERESRICISSASPHA